MGFSLRAEFKTLPNGVASKNFKVKSLEQGYIGFRV